MRPFVLFSLFFTLSSYSKNLKEGYENFHEIDAGKYYRSAQLTPQDFEFYINKHNIKTVINLRGENIGDDWYDAESEVMKRLGVKHVNIKMSASHIPHRHNLIALLEAFKTAPRPMLVHCQAGADRTGEASAIYQMLYMGKSKSQAMKMLGAYYGHLEMFKPAKDYFIRTVWKGLEWALKDYDPCTGEYRYYNNKNQYCQN